MERYFLEIIRLCEWGKFNILGHLTYPLRYIEGICGIKTDLSLYNDLIREALRLIIEKGIALEINSSGLRQKYGGLFPTAEIIKMYAKMGGKFVSLGSDSHSGKYFDISISAAKEAGINTGVYYEKRKPFFTALISQ